MSYLNFDKSQLINLKYSLEKEILYTNGLGAYALTTIIGCNTRKYHGLLVAPMKHLDGDNHVLLSSMDETVIQKDSEFNLGIRKYQGDNYTPKGHKYVRDFMVNDTVKTVYRVGNVILSKEILMVQKQEQLLIRYTVEDALSDLTLRFRPFMAFRNVHDLSRANLHAQTRVEFIKNGIRSQLYDGYAPLNIQFSSNAEFVQVPDWYYDVEYSEEMKRGYPYKEDLFTPGFFEIPAKKGDVIVFSAATSEINPTSLKRKFTTQLNTSGHTGDFQSFLKRAAQQFIVEKESNTEIIAGYPWFGSWGRDTFIALPGLTFALGDIKTGEKVLDSMVKQLKNGLFPNFVGTDNVASYHSIDAPLWFFHTLQQYVKATGKPAECWKKYGPAMKEILKAYKNGTDYNIRMHDNGLVYGGKQGFSLTWMDAVIQNVPVTPRIGYPVEVNALWYNAMMFALELAGQSKDKQFIDTWQQWPEITKNSFMEMFWKQDMGYLADLYNPETGTDWAVRCNMLIACALPYTMLDKEITSKTLEVITNNLLTPRGLRTLSPKHPDFIGFYEGTQDQRDHAYHQGTVWPWLLEFYANAYLSIYKKSGVQKIKRIIDDFENDLYEYGVGTIAEVYDGNPPHRPKGAVSQAWSVAAIIQANKLLEAYN